MNHDSCHTWHWSCHKTHRPQWLSVFPRPMATVDCFFFFLFIEFIRIFLSFKKNNYMHFYLFTGQKKYITISQFMKNFVSIESLKEIKNYMTVHGGFVYFSQHNSTRSIFCSKIII